MTVLSGYAIETQSDSRIAANRWHSCNRPWRYVSSGTYGENAMKTGEGIISHTSKYSVVDTIDRLEALLRARGVEIFVRIDHAGKAAAAGLAMPPTELLIFGNPKVGTPVMLAAPTAAIDLPLKALAWQDPEGTVWFSYNDPAYIARRFGLTDSQVAALVPIGSVLEQAAD